MWNPATGKKILQLEDHSGAVMGEACHAEGDFLVSCGGYFFVSSHELFIRDAETGEEIRQLEHH